MIRLIGENVCAEILNEDGDVTPLTKGIHQGSSLAPVLSNIFLMDFDNLVELKNTKPLEEKLIIDGDTAEDEDIYKEMNVVF